MKLRLHSLPFLAALSFAMTLGVHAASLTWDITPGTVGTGNGSVTGGTGAWITTSTVGNWTADGGANNIAWVNANNDSAIFGGTAGTVTVTSITANSLTFNSGYTVTGSTLTLAGTTPTITTSTSATVSSILAGTAGLVKAGTATLTLSASNTLTGGVTVSAGTLFINNTGGVGNNAITLGDANTGSNNIAIQGINGGATASAGSGTITVANAGTGTVLIDLGPQNANWANNFVINRATTVQSDAPGGGAYMGSYANGSKTLTGTGALTLKCSAAGNLYASLNGSGFSGPVTIAASTRVSPAYNAYPFGTGAVTMQNSSQINMSSFGDSINVTDLSDAGATGTTVVLGSYTLTMNSVAGATFGGVISGTGAVTKTGTGTQTLTGLNTYTGATTISGGTLQIGGSATLNSGAYAGAITNTAALRFSSSANQTLSGIISGTGGTLTKDTGTGTLTLSNNNTYSGATTVNAGRLNLTGTNVSSITLTGSTLGGTGSTTGGLTTNAGSVIAINSAGASAAFTANAVNIAGATTVAFDVAPTNGTTYTVVNYGSLPSGITNLSVPGYRAVLSNDGISKVQVTTTTGFRTWNAGAPGNWDIMTSTNWAEGDFMFANGDAVIFNDTATNGAVTLVGNLSPISLTIDNNTTPYTFGGTGSIIGSTGVSKTNTGTAILANTNAYTGTTTVTNGTLVGMQAGSFGTGAISLGGGTLELRSDTATIFNNNTTVTTNSAITTSRATAGLGVTHTMGTLSIGAQTLTVSSAVATGGTQAVAFGNTTLTGSPIFNVTGGTLGIGAITGGANSITKTGAGTLALTGTNTFTGGTTISAGTLSVGGGGATGTLPTTPLTVALGATLAYNFSSAYTATPLTVTGNLAYTSAGRLTLNAGTYGGNQVNATGTDLYVGGALVINAGAGGATITGTNTTSAGITSGSAQNITTTGNVTFYGSMTSNSQYVDGVSLAGIYTATTGTLTFDGTAGSSSGYGIENGVSGGWAGTIQTFGNVTFKGTGGTGRPSDINIGNISGNGTLTLIGRNRGLNSNANFTSSGGSPLNVVIQTTAGGINGLLSSGTDTTGNGNYTINAAGTVVFGARTINAGTGTISLTSATGYTISDNTSLTGAALTMGDTTGISITAGKTLTLKTTGTINNNISGGNVAVSAGTVTLGGANSYTGATTVNSATLLVNGSLNAGSTVTVNSGATLGGTGGTINGPVSVVSGATLAGAGCAFNGAVTVQSGAVLTPAGDGTIGTLTANGTMVLAGTAKFDIRKSGATLTCDSVTGTAPVTLGGQLVVTATGDALAAGDSFTLFGTTGGFSGSFGSYVWPSLPAGLSWDWSQLAVSGIITVVNSVSAPTFSPPGGGYASPQSVTITSDSGATIYYTTDGSAPTTSSSSGLSPLSGITVPVPTANMIIKAFAHKDGQADSAITQAIYNTVATPTWNVNHNGLWSDSTNWLNNVIPDASGVPVDFDTITLTADTAVTLDTNRTVGSLTFGNASAFNWTIAATGGSVLTLDGTTTPNISVVNNTATIPAVVAGSEGFIKSGGGTLKLAGANTITGAVSVTGGTLDVGGGTATGMIPTTAVTVDSGATLAFDVSSALTTVPLSVNGNLSYASSAARVTLPNGTYAANQLTVAGSDVLVNGALTINAGAGNATITGSHPSTAGITCGSSQNITTTGDVTFTGSSTSSTFYIDGISLAGVFTATTGTLTLDGTAGAGGGYGIENGVSGAWEGTISTYGNVTFKGTGNTGRSSDTKLGNLSGNGTVTVIGRNRGLNNNSTFTAAGGLPYNVVLQTTAGGITGILASGTDNTGNGNYTINSAANVSFGARTINAGTGTISLTSATGYAVTDNTTLQSAALVMGDTHDIAVTTGKTLTLNTTATLANNITTGGNLAVAGHALTLTGTNTYSGTTAVNAGTLTVNGTNNGGGAVTVATGATLAGSGTLTGPVTAAGTVAPGNGVGNLATGSLVLSGNYACDIDGATADCLVVTGDLNLTGSTLVVNPLTTPTANSYVIATYTGTLTGTFANVPAGYVVDTTGTPNQVKLLKSAGYVAWAAGFPGLTDTSPGGDPDHDGIPNLLEYVFGGDPRVSSSAILPTQAIVGDNLVISYKRNNDSVNDTTQTGQWSTDFVTWHDIAPVVVNDNAPAPDDMEIRIPLSNAVNGVLFGRLHVTQP